MKRILFIDQCAPYLYDYSTINNAQGGTETAVTKIAEALGETNLFQVFVEQHQRRSDDVRISPLNVTYAAFESTESADYVICLRRPDTLLQARKRFPYSKIYLWAHDLADRSLGLNLPTITEAATESIICVSGFHKTNIIENLKPFGYTGEQARISVLYNAIADNLLPDNTPVDRNKLCFISSPHKGLEYTLELFANLLSFNPEFQLYVSNPGYFPDSVANQKNVHILGRLPHGEVISHLRSSLCLFYPNVVFPETFGMVLAESDAVGTPVLTHAFGAATEVVDHPYETLDCRNPNKVINRVMDWYKGDRPRVRGNPKFRLSNVIKSWIKLFT